MRPRTLGLSTPRPQSRALISGVSELLRHHPELADLPCIGVWLRSALIEAA